MNLDIQRRLKIPNILIKDIKMNLPCKVRLAVQENRIVLFQHTGEESDIEYHDILTIDDRGRCILKKQIIQMAGIDDSTEFMISALQNQIIIRWK